MSHLETWKSEKVSAKIHEEHCKPSSIPDDGLEIPLIIKFEHEDKEILEKIKLIVE